MARASSGSGVRVTRPSASRRCTWAVIDGWLQWSAAARVVTRAGPEVVDEGEHAGLGEGHAEVGVPGGPAREACGAAQQLVGEGVGRGHSTEFT